MELDGLLSNPQVLDEIRNLMAAIEKTLGSGKRLGTRPAIKPRQGEILQAMKLVLMEHPNGLQTFEVRKLVEERLDRKLSDHFNLWAQLKMLENSYYYDL